MYHPRISRTRQIHVVLINIHNVSILIHHFTSVKSCTRLIWCFSNGRSLGDAGNRPKWQSSCTHSALSRDRVLFGVECIPHYDDVIMSEIASQITSLTIVYSTVLSGADQSKHQSSASLAFVWEIHRWPVNFPHKWPVTRKIFPFDDVIMTKYAHGS